MSKRARAAEVAAVAAVFAERETVSRRLQRRQLEATIETVSKNAAGWDRDGFPNAAARAWAIVDESRARLAALDA